MMHGPIRISKPVMEKVQKVDFECHAPSSEACSSVYEIQSYFTILQSLSFSTLFKFILHYIRADVNGRQGWAAKHSCIVYWVFWVQELVLARPAVLNGVCCVVAVLSRQISSFLIFTSLFPYRPSILYCVV